MSRVFWDTNLFIYLFEDYGALSEGAGQLRSKMLDRGDQLLTSTLTLGEILVKPTERSDSELCGKYEHAILAAAIMIAAVEIARSYFLHSSVLLRSVGFTRISPRVSVDVSS